MNTQFFNNYESLSEALCDTIIDQIVSKPNACICLATGHSPLLGYQKFVEKVKLSGLDLSAVTFIKLDEWCGLPMNHPATCEFFLKTELLDPLNIQPSQFISFNSQSDNWDDECKRISDAIADLSPDLAIVGIGKNGHIALNEPSDSLIPSAHVTPLDTKTKTHTMLTSTDGEVNSGVTLGFKELLQFKKIALIIAGSDKKDAYDALLSGNVTTAVPATFLHMHQNVSCFVDKQSV